MKFLLTTSGVFYDLDRAKKLEKLGFVFTDEGTFRDKPKYITYDGDVSVYVEINTLEELMDFQKEYGDLIISKDEIEIYDAYRE